ncbi:MAG: phosphatidate cytidylyltransferase [Roseovarius sp.]|nr:phosphatidate cytidylyltransferase [Roseovarius sp.]
MGQDEDAQPLVRRADLCRAEQTRRRRVAHTPKLPQDGLEPKAIGRRKIAPRLSPSKTVEGFVGGVGSATLLGACMWWITPFTFWQSGLLALIVALMGFFGGLALSAVKRDRGVKDWGATIAGHGGFIDRLDPADLRGTGVFPSRALLVRRSGARNRHGARACIGCRRRGDFPAIRRTGRPCQRLQHATPAKKDIPDEKSQTDCQPRHGLGPMADTHPLHVHGPGRRVDPLGLRAVGITPRSGVRS